MELLKQSNGNFPRTDKERTKMAIAAAKHYGKFLNALGYDYLADRQTVETPTRVAKAWVKDLALGAFEEAPKMTIFPNDQKYAGVVIQTGIRVTSMCAHHNLPFTGWASVAYIPEENVIGLSKLNRVVEWFAKRPQMQESLTQQIHTHLVDGLKCDSVAVSISAKHTCCGNRGVKHPESVMTTNSFTGKFLESNNLVREEFLHAIEKNGNNF